MRFDVHHHIGLTPEVSAQFCALQHKLGLILSNQEKTMAAIDDLKAAIADLATELADNNAEIEALLTKISTPGTSDADIAAAVADIRGLIATNKAEVDKAKAAVPA
jgi:chromosome segregation ATPase